MIERICKTHLEDGVHDTGERPVVRMLRHPEDIQAPSVDVLQVLQDSREEGQSHPVHGCHVTMAHRLHAAAAAPAGYLGQQLLLVRLDSEAVGRTSRDAGRVADLPHPADLSHHPTMLLLLLLLALPPLPFP